MHILRRIGLWFSVTIFSSLLFSFGLIWSTYHLTSQPDSLKHALVASGFYEGAVDGLLDQLQEQNDKRVKSEGEGNIKFSDAALRQTIKQNLPAEYLQRQVEGSLDDIYAWLEGDKAKLVLSSIDIDELRNRLANGLETYTVQRLDSLPVCQTNDFQAGVDPFNATCRPSGVDVGQEAAKQKQQFLKEFLTDVTLDVDSLKADDGQTFGQKIKLAPKIYNYVTLGLWGLGALLLMLGAAVFFLSASWRAGLRKLASIMIAVGALSAALAWVASLGLKQVVDGLASDPNMAGKALQQKVIEVVEAVGNDFRMWWLWYGVVLVMAGVATLVTLHFCKGKGGGPKTPVVVGHDEPSSTPYTTDEPDKPTSEEEPKPKPKTRIMVQ